MRELAHTLWFRLALGAFVAGCAARAQPSATAAPSAAATTTSESTTTVNTPAPAPILETTHPAKPDPIQKAAFGKVDDRDVELYTLQNENGLLLKIATFGATITEFRVPDRDGKFDDIVLGFDDVLGYEKDSPYFGAIVGRVANRIRDAKFKLEGKEYKLVANDGPNQLHGGPKGWDKVIWSATPLSSAEGAALRLTYLSKDGEGGYPGNVTASVVYTLTNKNELKVEMAATTDRTTIVNMAQHTYWNLSGYASGSVLDQEVTLYADAYTPGNPLIPTGAVKRVKGTPFDFTQPKRIGTDLKAAGGNPIGFDTNFVVNGSPNALRPVARVKDPKSGRVLMLEADQPGVQFYTGNFLDGKAKGKGATYEQYSGFCLETQRFPNAINVPAWRDQVILKPGQTYKHVMVEHFTTE